MLDTPVAFLIFNRPNLTEIVFEAIAQAKPKKLLVVADGPRFPEEFEKCQKARSIIERIDWPCEVLTNFSEINLGCKQRISSGLNWVFSEVEEAIILEDDCLPTPSFFYFCETLLEHYRHDERIMHISGDNFQEGQSRNNSSYYFSKYTHVWGWASWRRAWQHYNTDMRTWPEYKKLDAIRSICEDSLEKKYWIAIFDDVFEGAVDTWDYQWLYTCWSQNGLSILPNLNLISNIGFGLDSTHTFRANTDIQLSTTDIWKISHPLLVTRCLDADTYTFNYHYGGKNMRDDTSFISKAKHHFRLTKSLLKQFLN